MSKAQFHDRRINFGNVPLNISTSAELFLKNISTDFPALYRLDVHQEFADIVQLDPVEGNLRFCEKSI